MVALQRSVGNRSATRLLSRLREKERFDAAVGASDWNAAALVLSDFDKGDTAPALGSLDVNQLRYLDDAVNRHHGWKGGESLSAQVRGAMELQGVDADRTEAGQGYGKAWGKYGKVVDGRTAPSTHSRSTSTSSRIRIWSARTRSAGSRPCGRSTPPP